MREIKFRGKEIKTGEWKYGDLMQLNDGSIRIGVQSKTWTDDGYHNNDYEYEFNVDEKTIGQFTCLLDKNGKEIYEGDYIETRQNGFGGVVTWHQHGYFYIKEPYKFKYDEESDCLPLGEFIYDTKCKVTILGNIHDNPELLKNND